MDIILGSKSKGRKKVLEDAGIDFKVMAADINEKIIRSDNYEKLPLLIAQAKTRKLLTKINGPAILITSDQIVVCNGKLREKPESEQQAREYLGSYSNFPAQTNTAVVVTNTINGKSAEGLDISTVFFKQIPSEIIDQIVLSGKAMDVAGGFLSEDPLFKPFIDRIEGDPTGVLGLPLKLTQKLINQVSIS